MSELLTRSAVIEALKSVAPGLALYREIQCRVWKTDVRFDRDFQKLFNRFYVVRLKLEKQPVLYAELEREKTDRRGFEAVLRAMHAQLNRVDASFASKVVATVDPTQPVIDSLVLGNVGLRLPTTQSRRRLERIVEVHRELADWYRATLASEAGQRALEEFDLAYPGTDLTDLKKLDLIIWQMR